LYPLADLHNLLFAETPRPPNLMDVTCYKDFGE
jgi:hypothetical protein